MYKHAKIKVKNSIPLRGMEMIIYTLFIITEMIYIRRNKNNPGETGTTSCLITIDIIHPQKQHIFLFSNDCQ